MKSQVITKDISFTERVFHFDTVYEKNGTVSHSFAFQNKGNSPITIERIYTDCGCIGADLSKRTFLPGEKGVLTVSFNPNYQSGFFSKEIAVFINEGKNLNHVWVEGYVKPYERPVEEEYPYSFGHGLHLRLSTLVFGYLKQGETKRMELHYANDSDRSIMLTFAAEGQNGKRLQFSNPGVVGAKKRGVLSVYYTKPIIGGDSIIYLYPYINEKRSPKPVEIKILTLGGRW